MNNNIYSNPYKKNRGFTMIELLVVIAIIGILAITLVPKLRKELSKAKVAKVQHKLGLIRSKLSIDSNFSDEFPDLVGAKENLLNHFDVHPTEAFSSENGSFGETDEIFGRRTKQGGWFYNRTTGEIYANLPNGAYTYDKVYEIWNEEIQDLIDKGIVDKNGKYETNSSFEPSSDDFNNWFSFPDEDIEYWSTTDPDDEIEIWKNGFGAVSEGAYFMELNGKGKGSVYQDIVTIPGTILEVSVNHRGREGEDKASLSISNNDGLIDLKETMITGNDKWKTYTYEYEVPEGQDVTRFSLDSISSVGGASYGNLIDNFTVQVKLD